MQRDINLIVIHCSASRDGRTLAEGDARKGTWRSSAQVIDRWHAEPLVRGGVVIRPHKFQRRAEWVGRFNPRLRHIAYHHVIDVDGASESGRHHNEMGAHAEGHNAHSIGICMLGTERFTLAAWEMLAVHVRELTAAYQAARVCGHRDLSPDLNHDGKIDPWEWTKICPGFDVAGWLARDMSPDPADVFPQPRASA